MIRLKREHMIKLNTNLLNGDGLPGIHLYYKYGGNDTKFLDADDICYIDENSKILAEYLLDRIDGLEILIDKMIEKGCIDNAELPDDGHMYAKLIEQYNYYSRQYIKYHNKKYFVIGERYLIIIKKLYVELNSRELVFVAIRSNSLEVIMMLMKLDFNFMVYCANEKFTPLSLAINTGHIEISVMVLEYTKQKFDDYNVYKMIHTSGMDYNYRPIFVAI